MHVCCTPQPAEDLHLTQVHSLAQPYLDFTLRNPKSLNLPLHFHL